MSSISENELKLYPNGFIVKRLDSEWTRSYCSNGCNYFGVEGDNWPISTDIEEVDTNETSYLYDYICTNVEEMAYNCEYAAICSDVEFIKRYLKACEKATYEIQLLFCETQKSLPLCNMNPSVNDNFKFIGYDYAYVDVDYYSCIFHDIRRFDEFKGLPLNRDGLFETISEITNFVNLRNKLKQIFPTGKFEDGRFSIYRLWRYEGDLHELE